MIKSVHVKIFNLKQQKDDACQQHQKAPCHLKDVEDGTDENITEEGCHVLEASIPFL